MKQILFVCTFLLAFSIISFAQPTENRADYMKEYNRRIRKEMLNNVYIPKNLNDAFVELTRLVDKKAKVKFKGAEEDTVAKKLYFSLGRWIVHNWGFHGGSRLSHHLKEKLGVSHPEDQAVFIIRTYHRSLNRKELNVKELVEELNKKRHETIMKSKKIIKSEKRKREAP